MHPALQVGTTTGFDSTSGFDPTTNTISEHATVAKCGNLHVDLGI